MTGYIIRRLLLMILTLFGMSILIFVMLAPRSRQHRRYSVQLRRLR